MNAINFLKQYKIVKVFMNQRVSTKINTEKQLVREFGKDCKSIINSLSEGYHSFGDENILYKVSKI